MASVAATQTRECAWCGAVFVPFSLSRFCGPECKSEKRMDDEENGAGRASFVPSPEHIAEQCRLIRTGELVIGSTQKRADPGKRRCKQTQGPAT